MRRDSRRRSCDKTPRAPASSVRLPWSASRVLLFRLIDSILTNWLASMRPARAPETIIREVFDEAARLFPQQRFISGQDRVEPEGFERGSPAASPSQGRAARSGLPRDQ